MNRRILIVTDAWKPQVNGVVRTYEYLSAALEALGHTVKVIGPSDFPVRFPMPGYREIELTLFPYAKLSRLIRDFAPTSVHIGTEGPLGWAARRWCIKNGVRFTTAYHTQFPEYAAKRAPFAQDTVRRAADALLRRFHAASAGIVTTTASIDAELRARGYTMPLHAMPRGVPADLFSPGASPLFTDLKRPVALYAGRVAVEKNIEAFLGMDWHGSKVVVGDGPSFDTLKAKYPATIFAGKKFGEDLASHYRAADVFVFPSHTDTFGIVLIEAISCGLPVAAFNVPGPKDIVTENFLGVLHDDLSAAARAAVKLEGHAAKRHAHVRAHYTWDAIAKRFIQILDETKT